MISERAKVRRPRPCQVQSKATWYLHRYDELILLDVLAQE
jgi:hypothetical protein